MDSVARFSNDRRPDSDVCVNEIYIIIRHDGGDSQRRSFTTGKKKSNAKRVSRRRPAIDLRREWSAVAHVTPSNFLALFTHTATTENNEPRCYQQLRRCPHCCCYFFCFGPYLIFCNHVLILIFQCTLLDGNSFLSRFYSSWLNKRRGRNKKTGSDWSKIKDWFKTFLELKKMKCAFYTHTDKKKSRRLVIDVRVFYVNPNAIHYRFTDVIGWMQNAMCLVFLLFIYFFFSEKRRSC